jgi:hypothetical protein
MTACAENAIDSLHHHGVICRDGVGDRADRDDVSRCGR